MKRLGWGVLAFILSLSLASPAHALETTPTTPNKVAGPFIVTGYSFSGASLRYVQLFNSSSSLASLDGWQVASTSKTAPTTTTQYGMLSGQIEPGKHIVAAIPGLIDRASLLIPVGSSSATANINSVTLAAPLNSGLNDEVSIVPTISSSTIKEADGAFTNYYVRREISVTTGNYLSGVSFVLPTERLKNDQLYSLPQAPLLQVVEIYPDSPSCSPFDTSALCTDYIKLQNASTSTVDLSRYRIRTGAYGQASSTSNTRTLTGTVESGHFVTVPLTLSSTGNWVWLEDQYGTIKYELTSMQYPTNAGHANEAWAYDHAKGVWRWTNLPMPGDMPAKFPTLPPINLCTGLRISEVAANISTESQYVELFNQSDQTIDTSGCKLQTNRSSAVYELTESSLSPYNYETVYIKDTDLTLTKTTSGTVYLLSSDLQSEVDRVSYSDLHELTSWAYIDESWVQTYAVTPGLANVSQTYPACAEGYIRTVETANCIKVGIADNALSDCGVGKYRSPDTNRCRSLEALATALTPCDVGQYRNPETNRCRSLLSTTSSLTACAAGQERNPDTNRCRATATDDGLKPCNEGQERNPETNRCRNKTGAAITSDFPVEAVAQSGKATLGWWAFGGMGALAAAYAGWEWRREVISWIKKVSPFVIGRS